MQSSQKIETQFHIACGDPTDAIMAQLREYNAAEKPINLLDIGPTLVGAGYTHEQLVNGLFYLQSMKQIELMDGNRVRLVMS